MSPSRTDVHRRRASTSGTSSSGGRNEPPKRLRHGIGDGGTKRMERIVAPRVEDHDRHAGLVARDQVGFRDAAKMMGDAGSQHGALADAGLPVQDSEAGGHQVRFDQRTFSLAPEEEPDVQVGVLERRQPLVRRERFVGRQLSSSFPIRRSSVSRYSSSRRSKLSIPRSRQSSCSSAETASPIAHER